jgi:dTDP-glucose 4,6-dehydratase
MTKVLITGAGGFIGHHCLQHFLINTDWEIVATDSFRHLGKTDRITQVLAERTQWQQRTDVITHDLTAPFSDQALARTGSLDYLIALASESHVDRSITDPVPFVLNNTAVMLHTLELARALKPRAVIVVSTDEVYGPLGHGQRPHREWDPALPSNPYSASKAAQEALAVSYWRTYQVPVVITNQVNAFGERQDPEKYLPKLIRQALAGQKATVHGSGGNIGSRFYLHARNAADAWLFLLRNVVPPQYPQALVPARFNISSATPVTNLEMALEVASVLSVPLRYELVPFHDARPGHDPHYGLDAGKLTGLGWQPPVDFRESLHRVVKWTADHRDWLL